MGSAHKLVLVCFSRTSVRAFQSQHYTATARFGQTEVRHLRRATIACDRVVDILSRRRSVEHTPSCYILVCTRYPRTVSRDASYLLFDFENQRGGEVQCDWLGQAQRRERSGFFFATNTQAVFVDRKENII